MNTFGMRTSELKMVKHIKRRSVKQSLNRLKTATVSKYRLNAEGNLAV
jgi:hypothetical protein